MPNQACGAKMAWVAWICAASWSCFWMRTLSIAVGTSARFVGEPGRPGLGSTVGCVKSPRMAKAVGVGKMMSGRLLWVKVPPAVTCGR